MLGHRFYSLPTEFGNARVRVRVNSTSRWRWQLACPYSANLRNPLGDVGDIDGVLEFDEADTQPGEAEELFKPRPEPGRLDLSQALYCCSPPRPEPGLEKLDKQFRPIAFWQVFS